MTDNCGYDWCGITNFHTHRSDNPGETRVKVAIGSNFTDVMVYQEFTEMRAGRFSGPPAESAKKVLEEEFGMAGIGLAHTPMADALRTSGTSINRLRKEQQFTYGLPDNASEELRDILVKFLPEWYTLFCEKNAGYQNDRGTMFELGLAGQYSDMHRKFMKLKRAMWEGKPLVGEQLDEILMDMIGHCFLALVCNQTDNPESYDPDDAPDFD